MMISYRLGRLKSYGSQWFLIRAARALRFSSGQISLSSGTPSTIGVQTRWRWSKTVMLAVCPPSNDRGPVSPNGNQKGGHMLINRGRTRLPHRGTLSAQIRRAEVEANDQTIPPFALPTIVSRIDLMSDARDLVALYRKRNELFAQLGASDIFGDPAWHMLIDLYLERKAGRRMSVSDLCVGSTAPQTTALRYITIMVKRGLLIRVPDEQDGRRVFVELAPHTTERLAVLFED
jgi:DNA-binding MarR family transcriptional regulator